MSAVTAVTAQNTRALLSSIEIPVDNIELQVRAVMDDLPPDAIKTGMLSSRRVVSKVAELMAEYRVENLVVDPVMVSTGGDPLIDPEAVGVVRDKLLPLARIVTPNLREAEFLLGRTLESDSQIAEAAREIRKWGPSTVVVKGGHSADPERSIDYFWDGDSLIRLQAERIDTRNTHGSGCTFAAAIAAFLARGLELPEALREAKRYVTEAIRHSLSIGSGNGPLGHFHRFWSETPER